MESRTRWVKPRSFESRARSFSLKILFLSRSFEWGGAERQLVALATELARRGFDVAIAVFYPNSRLQERLQGTGVRLISLEKRGRWDVIGFGYRLVRLINREQPDFLHSYLTGPNVIAAALKVFYRHCRLIWGIRASFMDLNRYDRTARIFSYLESQLSRVPDLIICNSNTGFRAAKERGFPAQNMRVICNGIDTDKFVFDAPGRNRLREQWGIAGDRILVGLVARADPMKDVPTFIEAASIAAARNSALHFICIGRGMRKLDAEHAADYLSFAEAEEDAPAIFSALDLLCSSSRFGEGFSNVVAEAMCCGRPCVVTDVGDSALIVGDTGIVVPAGDPKRLAEAILSIVAKDLESRGGASRQRVVEHFGLERLGADTESALQRLRAAS